MEGCIQGMDEEQLHHVFTPFFTTKSSGTGLGLTLVQQIAIEHGGHVECESRVGKGTTFTINLPLADGSHLGRIVDDAVTGIARRAAAPIWAAYISSSLQ
jgi:two-component system, sporulation sensor kinase E